MDSTRDPPGQWADRTIGESLPRTFTRRWVVLPSRSSRPYRPADWVDTLVVVGRGEVEIECLGGTRQRFGAGEILFLDGLPLRALRSPGPGSTLLIAVSRRSSRRRRSVHEMDGHSLDGTAWVVTVVDGAKVEGAARNSIRFGDGRVVGQVGINRFSASCVFADGRVTVGPIMSTLMAGPEAMMELESSFLGALEGEHPFWIEGSNLFIGAVASGIALRRLGPAPVAGTVLYRERMALPPGSSVTVELLDVTRADANQVVAATVMDDLVAPPFDFALQPPATPGPQRQYALRARITGPDGSVMWVTDEPVEASRAGAPVTLMCVRAGGA